MEKPQGRIEWHVGFDAGQDFVLEMIKQLAGVEFRTLNELITFVRVNNDKAK